MTADRLRAGPAIRTARGGPVGRVLGQIAEDLGQVLRIDPEPPRSSAAVDLPMTASAPAASAAARRPPARRRGGPAAPRPLRARMPARARASSRSTCRRMPAVTVSISSAKARVAARPKLLRIGAQDRQRRLQAMRQIGRSRPRPRDGLSPARRAGGRPRRQAAGPRPGKPFPAGPLGRSGLAAAGGARHRAGAGRRPTWTQAAAIRTAARSAREGTRSAGESHDRRHGSRRGRGRPRRGPCRRRGSRAA